MGGTRCACWGASGTQRGAWVLPRYHPRPVHTASRGQVQAGVNVRAKGAPVWWLVKFFRRNAPALWPHYASTSEAFRVGVRPVTGEGPPHGKLLPAVRQARLFACSWFSQTPFLGHEGFLMVSFWVSFGVINNDP